MSNSIRNTALYKAMIARGDSPTEAFDAIVEMRKAFLEGADPEELLHDEGFEPDYIFDIL